MQIMIRHADDDFVALTTANGMIKAGADVFSVTDAGGVPFAKNIGRFIVWAKVNDEAHIAKVDESIAKELNAADKREQEIISANQITVDE